MTVTPVSRQDIKAEVQGTGTVTVDVLGKTGSKINERIKEALVDENDLVEKGRTIALLEDTGFRRKIDQAQARLYANYGQGLAGQTGLGAGKGTS